MALSNEFKVGLFVLLAGGVLVFFTRWSIDGIRPAEKTYVLHLAVPSADGLYKQTSVKLAGVEIGAVGDVKVVKDRAILDLKIRSENELPIDTQAEIRSSGIIGDRYISIRLGADEPLLKDGDMIELHAEPPDFEKIEKQVQDITEDVSVITEVLRKMAENDGNREAIEATLQNASALSEELAQIAKQNHQDINAIVDSIRRLSLELEGFAKDTRGDVDEEMEKLKATTDTLNASMTDIESITGKIDGGEGTIGALVNDKTTVDLINETIGNANDVIEGFSGLHSEVYYIGRIYAGSKIPERYSDEFFYGNPLAGSGSNTVGIRLMPQEDFWYAFEFVDYPQGTVTYTEHFFPETGEHYTEWIREPNFRISFMMNKRWGHLGLRLGIKEGGGGVGATFWTLHDKLEIQADIFDFDVGSYPAMGARGLPNTRVLARYNPMEHVYVEAGAEQILLGARYGYFTGFVGAGFRFDDDDIKLLLATLPIGF